MRGRNYPKQTTELPKPLVLERMLHYIRDCMDTDVLGCSKLKQRILKFKELYHFLTYCKMQLECAKDSA